MECRGWNPNWVFETNLLLKMYDDNCLYKHLSSNFASTGWMLMGRSSLGDDGFGIFGIGTIFACLKQLGKCF